jgi:hypothetical protein
VKTALACVIVVVVVADVVVVVVDVVAWLCRPALRLAVSATDVASDTLVHIA